MPGYIAKPGNVGVVSKSGTLTYEVVYALTARGIGQSTCVGIGGDPIIGTDFVDVLQHVRRRPADREGRADRRDRRPRRSGCGRVHQRQMTKPVVAFIAGSSAPAGTRMGHAGAIIEGGEGTAQEKIKALSAAGVRIAENPEQIPDLLLESV